MVAEIVSACRTKTLNLSSNKFTEGLDLSSNSTLQLLNISHNNMSSIGASKVFSTLRSKTHVELLKLWIDGEPILNLVIDNITKFEWLDNSIHQIFIISRYKQNFEITTKQQNSQNIMFYETFYI